MPDLEIDGFPVDLGPSGVSQAAATPPAGETVVQPPANEADPPANPDPAAPPAGDGTGDPVTPTNDGTDPAGVYSAETVAAREAAAEERGKQAALAQLQEAAKTQRELTLKEQANESYRVNVATQRTLLEEAGHSPEEIQKIMGPVDTHNRFVVGNAFKVGLELAGQEYADNLAAKLGDKATEFFNHNGGKPEPVSEIIDRYANVRGPDLPWFKDSDPKDLMELHKGLKAYVLTQIDLGVDARMKEVRPATPPAPKPGEERTPTGPIGLASYQETLKNGGKLPEPAEIDRMTKAYAESLA